MQLKIYAAIAALVGTVGIGRAQLLYSFETGLDGFTIGASAGTLTQDTVGATQGSFSMRLDRVTGSGWNQMTKDIDTTIRALLNGAAKKNVLVDVTQNDAGNYWRQMVPIFNSPSGGWSQGTTIGLNYAQTGTATYVLPYGNINVPVEADPWGQQVYIYQCDGNAAVAPIWFDNFRIESTDPGPSFESGVAGLVQNLGVGETADVIIEPGTIGATDGTASAKVTWQGGFRWMKLSLTVAEAAKFNESKRLILDVELPTRFEPGGWGNMRFGLNDSAGWRELPGQFDVPGWAGGKKTLAINMTSLASIPSDSTYREILVAINGPAGATKTFYMDNFRFEKGAGTAAAIMGRVDIDALMDDAGAMLKLQIRQPGTLTLAVPEIDVTLGANGDYSVPMGALPAGTYDLWFKKKNTISAIISNVTIGATGVSGQDIMLKAGDIDNDRMVTVFDYDKLSLYFDKNNADADWNTADGDGIAPADADLDGDGAITVFDYDILSTNFDLAGPE